jgi:hypothetical protein
MSSRIADMTLEELNTLIEKVVIQHLSQAPKSRDTRGVDEILESIDSHFWIPPAGAKSSLELLREDRDE